jgi:hypothetical protein
MAEAYLQQREFEHAGKVIDNAEKIFPGEKLLFEKKMAIENFRKKHAQKEKQKFKKMFAKK